MDLFEDDDIVDVLIEVIFPTGAGTDRSAWNSLLT